MPPSAVEAAPLAREGRRTRLCRCAVAARRALSARRQRRGRRGGADRLGAVRRCRGRRGEARFRACRALGAPCRRGRLGRRAGAARLHPDLRPGIAARPGGGGGMVSQVGRGELPAGPARLRHGAAARGRKRRRSRPTARAQLARAAEPGLPTAQYLLGVLTRARPGRGEGRGARGRSVSARRRRRACARRRRATAWRCWRAAASSGICRRRNPGCAAPALAGDPEAAALVGDLYARGGELPPNYAEAAIWFRRAAEAGHKTARPRARPAVSDRRRRAARPDRGGALVPRLGRGRRYRRRRHDLANAGAAGQGASRTTPSAPANGSSRRRPRATWWRPSISASAWPKASASTRDDAQAAQWLRRAADGVVNAQYWYGRMLIEGRGVEPDAGGRPRLDHARGRMPAWWTRRWRWRR